MASSIVMAGEVCIGRAEAKAYRESWVDYTPEKASNMLGHDFQSFSVFRARVHLLQVMRLVDTTNERLYM